MWPLARSCSLRPGEASVPGPRTARAALRRTPGALRGVELLEPATVALRVRFWDAFLEWVRDDGGSEACDTVQVVPALLADLLKAFAHVLFDQGTPLTYYRQLLAHAQKEFPAVRPLLRPAWDNVTRWEQLEPVQHRPPLPEPLLWALVALGVAWKWYRWSAVTLFCFYCCCRPGEVLQANRSSLLTAQDILESGFAIYLKIAEPKTRRRGARVQHSVLKGPEWAKAFITCVFQDLVRSENLFGSSAYAYRRRWDRVLGALKVPFELRLTPASMRGGGAVASFRSGEAIQSLQWRMRLQHQHTLALYLQEVIAISILPSLDSEARSNIQAAAACAQHVCSEFSSRSALLELLAGLLLWWSCKCLKGRLCRGTNS